MTADRFYVIDVETTGLDEKNGSILEIACVVTNVDFEVIAEKSWLIWDDEVNESLLALRRIAADDPEGKTGESFVLNMHQSSGLFDELRAIQESGDTSHSRMIVGVQVFEWLKEQGLESTDPMTGSSVQFDRRWLARHMPGVEGLFHYRNEDISTLKGLARRFAPVMLASQPSHVSKHRALDDAHASIAELKWYRDNFLRAE